jgi:hypothetical protein
LIKAWANNATQLAVRDFYLACLLSPASYKLWEGHVRSHNPAAGYIAIVAAQGKCYGISADALYVTKTLTLGALGYTSLAAEKSSKLAGLMISAKFEQGRLPTVAFRDWSNGLYADRAITISRCGYGYNCQ